MAPLHCYCLYGYGLYSYGRHSHGLYSYGLVMPHRIERQNGRADRALRHRLAALIRAPRHLAVSSYGPHCYGLSCIVMACAPHDTWRKRRGDESSAASQSSLGTRHNYISASPTACLLRRYGRAVGDADIEPMTPGASGAATSRAPQASRPSGRCAQPRWH